MIDISELRKGNYVRYIDDKSICQLSINGIHQIEMGAHKAKPILLTAAWLSKFGFNNLGEYGWGIAYFHIRYRKIHGFHFVMANRIVRIKTVHHLQNLFHSLAGEELKIK